MHQTKSKQLNKHKLTEMKRTAQNQTQS